MISVKTYGKRASSALIVGVVAFACTKSNPPPAPPSEDERVQIAAACVTLRRYQCPEGTPPGRTCTEALTVVATMLPGVHVPASCIAQAADVDAVRRCGEGDPTATRVRCKP